MNSSQLRYFFSIGSIIATAAMGIFTLLLAYFSFREKIARNRYLSNDPSILETERKRAKKYLDGIDLKILILTMFASICFFVGLIFQLIGFFNN